MALELWTSADIYATRQDLRLLPVPDWFRQNFFGSTYYSSDQEIKIAELPVPYRRLAPFVMPSSQGKPIFARRGESVKSITPAYIKPKDAVRPQDAANVLPSEIFLNGGVRPSVQDRFDQRVVEVAQFHLRAIDMTIAWLCARAIIDGKYVINYASDQAVADPQVTVDFGRDAGQTITLSSAYWSDPDYDIIGDLTAWSNTMYAAKYGGRPTRVVVGASVVQYLQKNKGILALLNTQIRGGEGTAIQRGMLNIDTPMTFVMTLGGIGQSLEIWTYKDVVEDGAGNMIDIFDPRDVLLIAPGNEGVIAYGAIWDADAMMEGALAVDVYPKMWTEKDPGEVYLMHQSSPLPFVLYPNRTLKARVLP